CALPQRLCEPARSARRAKERAAQPPPGAAGALGAVPEHRGARKSARRRLGELRGIPGAHALAEEIPFERRRGEPHSAAIMVSLLLRKLHRAWVTARMRHELR